MNSGALKKRAEYDGHDDNFAPATTETTTARPRRRRLRRVLKYGSALLVVLLAWVAFDLLDELLRGSWRSLHAVVNSER